MYLFILWVVHHGYNIGNTISWVRWELAVVATCRLVTILPCWTVVVWAVVVGIVREELANWGGVEGQVAFVWPCLHTKKNVYNRLIFRIAGGLWSWYSDRIRRVGAQLTHAYTHFLFHSVHYFILARVVSILARCIVSCYLILSYILANQKVVNSDLTDLLKYRPSRRLHKGWWIL